MNQKKKSRKDRIYSLCEAVADIAFIAGSKQYYSGNSREDMAHFIAWAEEFEKKWKNKEWGADETEEDYIDEITKFAVERISAAIEINQANG